MSETRYGLATVLQEAGDNARAKEIVEALITERPDYAEAYVTRGNVHAALDRHEDAIRDYQTAIGLKPGLVVAHYNLGHARRQSGRLQDAKVSFEAALGLDPELASAYNGLGALCQQLAEHENAVEHFDKALAINPGLGDALNNKAISLQMLGRYQEAVEAYKAYIAENPGRGEVYFNFGGLLQTLEQWEPSLVVLREGLAQDPGCLDIYPFYLHALMQLCDWSNLDALIHKLVEITKTQLAAKTRVSFTPFALQSLPGEVPMALRRLVAEAICERISDSVTQSRQLANFSYNKGPHRQRLTIGYVSPDLRAHSVAVAFRGIMENHDRDRFTYNAYSLHPGPPDPFGQYFRSVFDSFVDAAPLSHEEAARRINDDGVDILVDLAGHTRGTRLEIFALRPALVQAHYLGYSATIGARFLDYLITDHQQVPAAERSHFTEQLVYLPDSFMAARRADVDATPPSRAEEGLPEDGFVFANFNKHYKHEPKMFGLAMRLLKQWPGSVYWLRHGTPQSDGNLRREAAARGVDPERLIFAENKSHPKHLARLSLADLALDNFYHGGGVTTVDALWVGLPVLSLAGQTPQSRNGASLLSAIGMAELIADRTEDFEAKARQLLGDPTRLADLRRRLLENRVTHPLFDIARLTRKLEQAYEMMWEVHAAGDSPRMIEVPRDD
ncbi:MAG: tetratricopeptide repeat protein [Alphaproteobacteria bacterium]|nr:tetratricopeptide repeat protein [Alphaproteobacteria bacterium]